MKRSSIALSIFTLFAIPASLLAQSSSKPTGDRVGELASTAAVTKPAFSWDTLPLYIHVRKARKFTPEELKHLASFPLITLEKTTGVKDYGSTEAGTIQAAKAIKVINPAAKVLFYRNVIVHYTGYRADDPLKSIPNAFLTNKKGIQKLSLIHI